MTLHPSAKKVAEAAQNLDLSINIVEFSSTTRTANDAAAAIGCEVAQIVKSLLFAVNGEPVMTLIAGNNRLDDRKLAGLYNVGRKKVRRSDADAVKATTGFTIGGVPPFGHKSKLPMYVDQDLMLYDVVWAAAGTPYAVFAIAPQDLLIASTGTVADLKL